MNIVVLDEQLSAEIEKLIDQQRSEEKIQRLLRLESMISNQMNKIYDSPLRYKQKETIQFMRLKHNFQRIQSHFDDALGDDEYFLHASNIWGIHKDEQSFPVYL